MVKRLIHQKSALPLALSPEHGSGFGTSSQWEKVWLMCKQGLRWPWPSGTVDKYKFDRSGMMQDGVSLTILNNIRFLTNPGLVSSAFAMPEGCLYFFLSNMVLSPRSPRLVFFRDLRSGG